MRSITSIETELSKVESDLAKAQERIKEELFKAYQNSNRSMDQILSFMAGEEWDE